MRYRPYLPQAHLAIGIEVALAARPAASGFVEQAEAEGCDCAAIGAAFEMFALMILDRAVEIETEIGPAIERIGGHVGIGMRGAVRHDLRQCGQRHVGRRKQQVPIAALETRFGFERDSGPREPPLRPWAERPFDAVFETGRMRAASHSLAMGVENQSCDIAQAVRVHRLCQTALEAFNRETGGDLANKPACIGKPRLDRDTAARSRIGSIVRLSEEQIQETSTMFQSGFRFEQRRHIDLVRDPEQSGEIERGKHGRGLFALCHQHANRRIGIDMLENLRHCEKLAGSGRAFDGEAGEVGALRLDTGEELAQRRNGTPARQIDIRRFPETSPDGIVQLLRVHAEVNPAHAQAIRAHGSDKRVQGNGPFGIASGCIALQLLD